MGRLRLLVPPPEGIPPSAPDEVSAMVVASYKLSRDGALDRAAPGDDFPDSVDPSSELPLPEGIIVPEEEDVLPFLTEDWCG